MRRITGVSVFKAFTLCVALAGCAGGAFAAPSSSLVVDAGTGLVLQAVNADAPRYPASLTKMMTLYVTFKAIEEELLEFGDMLPVSGHAAGQKRSKLYLKEGSAISVLDALTAVITKSANDAAVVLAEAIGGTEENFARLMTKTAKKLGLTHTTFKNASGLTEEGQLTSARDMAMLAMALMRHFPEYYKLFSLSTFSFNGQVYHSTNTLLDKYDGAEGLKTGFTAKSGYHLVSSAHRDGRRLVAVTLGRRSAGDRDRHSAQLLDKGFKKLEKLEASEEGSPKENAKAAFISPVDFDPEDMNLMSVSVELAKAESKALPDAANMRREVTAGEWEIQIGAFRTTKQAFQAASAARAMLFVEGSGGELKVQPMTAAKSKKLYRARLAGLSEADAVQACLDMKRQRRACLVIRPSGNEATRTAKLVEREEPIEGDTD